MQQSLKEKRLYTVINAFCKYTVGIAQTLAGQALADIANIANTSTANISYGYSVCNTFSCIGAFFFGWTYKSKRQYQFIMELTILSLCMFAVPHISSLTQYLSIQAVFGFVIGGLGVVQNVLVLEMWEKESNPYMQATHLCWALGSTTSPLITGPFLSPKVHCEDSPFVVLNGSSANISGSTCIQHSIISSNQNDSTYLNQTVPANNVQLWIPFTIGGTLSMIAAFSILVLEIVCPYKQPVRSVSRKCDDNESQRGFSVSMVTHWVFIGLCAVILGLFFNGEVMLFYFLPTFLQRSPLGISPKQSSYMSAVMAGSHTLMGPMAVFIATKFRPQTMLYTCFMVVGLANLWILFLYETSEKMLLIPLALLGFGLCPVFPAFHSFVERYVDQTNMVSSVIMIISTLPCVIGPIILGQTIKSWPHLLIYMNLASLGLAMILFIIVHWMVKHYYTPDCSRKKSIMDNKTCPT